MNNLQVELFTTQTAVDAGLIEAVKRGEAKINGSYELTPDGFLLYRQNNFIFTDKFGNLRCGRFVEIFHDIAEIDMFIALFFENEGKQDENFNE